MSNSIVALFCTVTKPPMLGGVIPNSLKGKVVAPATSILVPLTRASNGMLTDLVVP